MENNNKFDIEREIERVNQDIDDMQKAGLKQIFLSFFPGMENEREFILAARKAAQARGYACVHDYEDDELVLIIRKVA